MVTRKLEEFLQDEHRDVSSCEWGDGSCRGVTEDSPGAAAPNRHHLTRTDFPLGALVFPCGWRFKENKSKGFLTIFCNFCFRTQNSEVARKLNMKFSFNDD